MRKSRFMIFPKTSRNEGFTLVELIISIAILVLIMLPLMNNFYRSAQMNKKAEEIQVRNNLASSILEGLKNLNLEETLNQFTGPPADFHIITVTDEHGNLIIDNIKVLKANGSTFEEVPPTEYDNLDEQAAYYFAINGIKEGSTAYDALITMNSAVYRTGDILNNYPMPDAINLDIMANGLLFSDGQTSGDTIDSQALATFLQWGEAYARTLFEQSPAYRNYLETYDQWENDCELALMQPTPMPTPYPPAEVTFDPSDYPGYCAEDEVKSEITKTMKITVNQASSNTVQYEVDYTCAWPAGSNLEDTLRYPVSVKNYSGALENIYLFYNPSVFKDNAITHPDVIELDNRTPEHPINFYLANQQETLTVLPDVNIIDNAADRVTVYTNLESVYVNLYEDGIDKSGSINSKLVKTSPKDRIYDTEIKIYQYVASDNAADKYKDELYTLSSATEN